MAVLDGNADNDAEHVLGLFGVGSNADLPQEGPGLQNVARLDIGARGDVQPQPDCLVAMPRGKLGTRGHETVPGRPLRRCVSTGPLLEGHVAEQQGHESCSCSGRL